MPSFPSRSHSSVVALALATAALTLPVAPRADTAAPLPPATPSDGSPPALPPVPPATEPLPLPPALAQEAAFQNASTGAIADMALGLGHLGGSGLFELGGRSLGIRTLGEDARWLLRWDGLLAARGGFYGSTVPLTPLAGAHGLLDLAIGDRLLPERALSPYLGVRAGVDLGWLPAWGVGSRVLSDMDGVEGFTANGEGRAEVGASYLAGRRSLLLLAFAGETYSAATPHLPSSAFTEAGLGLRFDLARALTLGVEASLGTRAARRDEALDRTDQTTRERLALSVRKVFGSGRWIGADVSAARELDRIRYGASGATYRTTGAPDLRFTAGFGIPLGPWR